MQGLNVVAKTGAKLSVNRVNDRLRERNASAAKAVWRLGRREKQATRRIASVEKAPVRFEEDAERWDGLS